jgi:hypothetical protein
MPIVQIPYVADATVLKPRARNPIPCALRLTANVEIPDVSTEDAPFVIRSAVSAATLDVQVDWRRLGDRFMRDVGPVSDAEDIVGAASVDRTKSLVRPRIAQDPEILGADEVRSVERDNSVAVGAAVQAIVSDEFVAVGERLFRFDEPPVLTNKSVPGDEVAWLPACLWDLDGDLVRRAVVPKATRVDLRHSDEPPRPRVGLPDFDRDLVVLRHILREESRVPRQNGTVFSTGSGSRALRLARQGVSSVDLMLEMERTYADLRHADHYMDLPIHQKDFASVVLRIRTKNAPARPQPAGRRTRIDVRLEQGRPSLVATQPLVLDADEVVRVATCGMDGVLDILHDGTDFLVPFMAGPWESTGMTLAHNSTPEIQADRLAMGVEHALRDTPTFAYPEHPDHERAARIAEIVENEVVVVGDRLYRRRGEPFLSLLNGRTVRLVQPPIGASAAYFEGRDWRDDNEKRPHQHVVAYGLAEMPLIVSTTTHTLPHDAERLHQMQAVDILRPEYFTIRNERRIAGDMLGRAISMLSVEGLPSTVADEIDAIAEAAWDASVGGEAPDLEAGLARFLRMAGDDWLLARIGEAGELAALRGPISEALSNARPPEPSKSCDEEEEMSAYEKGI